MSKKEQDVPPWDETTVKIVGRFGEGEVPALVHPWVKGLAVTMAHMGHFNVTHLASGMNMSALFERAATACIEAAEWAACTDMTETDRAAIIKSMGDDPVPFGDCTVTTGGVRRPCTKREWMQVRPTSVDEFPWEDSETSPWSRAREVLALLRPAPESESPNV